MPFSCVSRTLPGRKSVRRHARHAYICHSCVVHYRKLKIWKKYWTVHNATNSEVLQRDLVSCLAIVNKQRCQAVCSRIKKCCHTNFQIKLAIEEHHVMIQNPLRRQCIVCFTSLLCCQLSYKSVLVDQSLAAIVRQDFKGKSIARRISGSSVPEWRKVITSTTVKLTGQFFRISGSFSISSECTLLNRRWVTNKCTVLQFFVICC